MSHSTLLCAASEVDLTHCILPLIRVGTGLVAEKPICSPALCPLFQISLTDPFRAGVTRFGNSYGRKGIERVIHGKLLIYSTASGCLTCYFWGTFFEGIFLASSSLKYTLRVIRRRGEPSLRSLSLIYAFQQIP